MLNTANEGYFSRMAQTLSRSILVFLVTLSVSVGAQADAPGAPSKFALPATLPGACEIPETEGDAAACATPKPPCAQPPCASPTVDKATKRHKKPKKLKE